MLCAAFGNTDSHCNAGLRQQGHMPSMNSQCLGCRAKPTEKLPFSLNMTAANYSEGRTRWLGRGTRQRWMLGLQMNCWEDDSGR